MDVTSYTLLSRYTHNLRIKLAFLRLHGQKYNPAIFESPHLCIWSFTFICASRDLLYHQARVHFQVSLQPVPKLHLLAIPP